MDSLGRGHREYTRYWRKEMVSLCGTQLKICLSDTLSAKSRNLIIEGCELSVLRIRVRRARGVRSMRSRHDAYVRGRRVRVRRAASSGA